ncbi:MAG: hypothetical protein COW00_14365 [Bdellovibrio sp. CG12_big_fil_rev_8_21_14_0_65_39_13]|nr:MAG: hypothetical protein COW78_07890 [Bdellovibrio sp. CG22_combo_CG10-13_8_21_14_all_39_27]PIQ58797.1 MAG: hypothetical protein COW00_14365 [Bdellovibrio sp. CG12_big_fil_rev_8_21_14_0_65_39_13]PIR35522.1 MAG: hypothetical protein COV37_08585 [Bdellovibrio sp. CG11_big_fil_rev_8_21_14_0_20_39_38]
MKSFFIMLVSIVTLSAQAGDFEIWLNKQYQISVTKLKANINRADTLPGTVVASPSKSNPNYYYHWVRDASLVMLTIERMFDRSTLVADRDDLLKLIIDYADLTRLHQSQEMQAPGRLGEVKFNVDGTPFVGPWGRPQNDGPALRALTFIKLANHFLQNGHEAYVREVLYDGQQPSASVIKRDLEYVSHNWKNHDFDLWEEVMGHHFFTRLAQRRALLEGAELARKLGDNGAASWYELQARALETALQFHWSESEAMFKSTLNRVGGIDYKSGMDSSIFLGLINTERANDSFMSVLDDRFMLTAQKMNDSFANIYRVNQNFNNVGAAIGRYPEDQYDGYGTGKGGNPWFLTTAAFASYHYKMARTLTNAQTIKITDRNRDFLGTVLTTQAVDQELVSGKVLTKNDAQFKALVKGLVERGDQYMARIRIHLPKDGSMSEQMNRDHGYMQGAEHLTWSYSSFINAYLNRLEAVEAIGN